MKISTPNIILSLLSLLFINSPILSQAQISFKNVNNTSIDSIQCAKKAETPRTNLGLYGGRCLDLSFSHQTHRLFAAVGTAASLYASDDTGATWYETFPFDSLNYNCGEEGWGGGAKRVLTNNNGWVLVQTMPSPDLHKTASIVSFHNGDTGSWSTVMNTVRLKNLGLQENDISGIGMNDYKLFSLFENYIITSDSTVIDTTTDVINILSFISNIPSNSRVTSIAPSNTLNGIPYFICIDTTDDVNNSVGYLYKYDGINFSKINLPDSLVGITAVFNHPNQITVDTLFISAIDSNNAYKTYKTPNGGNTWIDITPVGSNITSSDYLSDVEYSSSWLDSLVISNGIILMYSGKAISKNMGNTWSGVPLSFSAGTTVLPSNLDVIIQTTTHSVYLSTTGVKGTFAKQNAEGLNAIIISKIGNYNRGKVIYLATLAGLAYTSAYKNSTVQYIDKWEYPYGKFPVDTTYGDDVFFSVVVNPFDSLNVIAGSVFGFYVTQNGPDNFIPIIPPGFNQSVDKINDIVFVSSTTTVAVSGPINDQNIVGKIWKSYDKGISWMDVSPTTFEAGNTIAVAYGKTDTVIYVGTGCEADTLFTKGYLWQSADLGNTWTVVNSGPVSILDSSVIDMPIWDIAVDPRGKDTLYIASGNNTDQALVKSYDGGKTFIYINAEGLGEFSAVMVHPDHPDSAVLAVNQSQIFRYVPFKDTAFVIFNGLPDETIPDLSSGSILVGTTTGFYFIEFEPEDDLVTIIPNKNTSVSGILIYPNPSNSYIQLSFENVHASKISIYDVSGKCEQNTYTVPTHLINGVFEIDIRSFSPGYYMIAVDTDKGKHISGFVKTR